MSTQAVNILTILISWAVLLYFVILCTERVISLVRIKKDGNVGFFETGFDSYVNILTMVSLILSTVMLIFCNKTFWISLFVPGTQVNYFVLVFNIGLLLLSGMVHTRYSMPGIQFAAYGMLIVAMFLRMLINTSASGNVFMIVFSFMYLVAFSMAIPVVYRVEGKNAGFLQITEAIGSIVLVACFTLMLKKMFIGTGENLLMWIPMILMVAYDTIIVCMNKDESKYYFLLTFEIITVILFILGKILFAFM